MRTVFTSPGPTFPFGTHVAVVEVDTETGKVFLRRVVTVDDAGTVINPLLAEGQRHGGIAQGAAQAFLEEVVYDDDGNPLTATFADYPFLSATEVPSFELVDMETPTSYNPLGAKGIGEAGSIGATPAVQNAVIDAVSHLGVTHIDMPTSPQRVWRAIQASQRLEGGLIQAWRSSSRSTGPRAATRSSRGCCSFTTCGRLSACAPRTSAATPPPAAPARCCSTASRSSPARCWPCRPTAAR